MKTSDFRRAVWRKSTVSAEINCVQVARVGEIIGVRDSKDTGGPILQFTPAEFAAFVEGAKRDEFNGFTG